MGPRRADTGRGRFAEVAVPVPVHGPFTYAVPPEIARSLAPGALVAVPFRKSVAAGLVLKLLDEPPPKSPKEFREILGIISQAPLIPGELISLVNWVAAYYLYPVGLAAKTALPEGLLGRPRLVYRATDEGRAALAGGKLSKKAQEIVARAAEQHVFPRDSKEGRLCARLSGGGLLDAGWELASLATRPRRLTFVSPKDKARGDLSVREESLLVHLGERGRLLKELKGLVPNFRRWVKSLEEKGLVELSLVETLRAPLAVREEPVPFALTREQKSALSAVSSARDGFGPFLLFGVTGSGKTEVYLRALSEVLGRGQGAMVLVPEIGLTPQMEARFRARLGHSLALMHSGLSRARRISEWLRLLRGEARVVLGTRSAVFAPVKDLGLIVVDEEHDPSYKQDEGLTYHARDVAVMRARSLGIPVVLGSATPSVESFHHAKSGRYRLITLPKRVDEKEMPRVEVVDLKGEEGTVSPGLKELLGQTLAAGDQAIFFLNRRGQANFVLCRGCGFVARCAACEVSLTLHKDPPRLLCHYCGLTLPPDPVCPTCGGRPKPYGVGTERVEEEVKSLFPGSRVARMDRDTTSRKDSHKRLIEGMDSRQVDVLVGTQMVSKGHHLPGVALVGVVNADTGLHMPDFRAAERTFQLLTQVAGRAGRGPSPGRVVVQTFSPDHPSIIAAASHDFLAFFEQEIETRRELGLPPFSRMIRVVVSSPAKGLARSFAHDVGQRARRLAGNAKAEVLGPAEAPLSRLRGRFRYHLLLKGESALSLNRMAARLINIPKKRARVRLRLDIDPLQML